MSWLYQERVLESTFYDDELEALWLPLFQTGCARPLSRRCAIPDQTGANWTPLSVKRLQMLLVRIAVRFILVNCPIKVTIPSTDRGAGAATRPPVACAMKTLQVIFTEIRPTHWACGSQPTGRAVFSRPSLNAYSPAPVSCGNVFPPCTLSRTLSASGYTSGEKLQGENNILIDS